MIIFRGSFLYRNHLIEIIATFPGDLVSAVCSNIVVLKIKSECLMVIVIVTRLSPKECAKFAGR